MIMKMKERLKDQKGLTLIELLAVIVILGIIAAIAIPMVSGIIEKSKYDAAKAEAIQAINSAKIYNSGRTVQDDEITLTELTTYLETPTHWSAFTITVSGSTYTFSGTANTTFTNSPVIAGDEETISQQEYNEN